MFWKILVLKLWPEKLLANQIARFFKFEYLKNGLTVCADFLYEVVKPYGEYNEVTHDDRCAPRLAQAWLLSANQIAWFFKFEYLKNGLIVWVDFLYEVVKPYGDYNEVTHDDRCAPRLAQAWLLSANQIAWFFKFEYLKNGLIVWVDFLYEVVKPLGEYNEGTHDDWCAPGGLAQACPNLPKFGWFPRGLFRPVDLLRIIQNCLKWKIQSKFIMFYSI